MKKSGKKIEWTEEADAIFSQLKKVLSTPPVLVDIYARFYSCRQCWASKCRGL
jgi:hypothetical protein